MNQEYVIIDLETTGLDIQNEAIIEIAAVRVRRGLIMDQFSTLIACDKVITPEIEALTGISNEMLEGQPELSDVLPMLIEFIGDADIVAHNAAFDSEFLHRFWPDDRVWIDTITMTQIAYPDLPSYALTNLSVYLNLEHTQAHRALGDALATAQLFVVVEKELDKLSPSAKEDIMTLLEGDDSPLGMLLRRKCASFISSSTDDDNKKPIKQRPAKKSGEIDEFFRINTEQIKSYLGEDSLYRDRLPGFEERPQQLNMSLAVANAFNEQSTLLVEAGTGTGKSLAYLLPAALFSCGSGQQVAISTHTRNLQAQLLEKDIPLLSGLLGRQVDACVVKGRSNYLCQRLYKYLLRNTPESMRYFLMRVAVWRSKTSSYDGSDLNLHSFDRRKWQRICASKENCAPFCPYGRKNQCFVQKIRAAAANADIVILNHSLLIANASFENGFLPDFSYLVIDEAQHLMHAAEDQLSSAVDIYTVITLLSRLTRREKGKTVGAIVTMRRQIDDIEIESIALTMSGLLDDIDIGIEQIMTAADQFFATLASCWEDESKRNNFYPSRVRILPTHKATDKWQTLQDQSEAFAFEMDKLSRDCDRLLDAINSYSETKDDSARINGSDELFGVSASLREVSTTLKRCMMDDDNYVTWVEYPDDTRKPSLNMAPIELGELLYNCLYEKTKSLVLTSATLAAGKDFTYFKHQLGLDLLPFAPEELVLSSPFAYRDQSLFTVVNNLPDWNSCGAIAAVDAISAALIQLLAASKGRAIVLFTSHHQLKSVFRNIKQPLAEMGITVLAHGLSGEVSGLLQRLKTEDSCCILGANSFWEGVDVIGDALSMIVVVRLPFWPPNSPLAMARADRFAAEGRSAFYEYSLPQALIRFKQGFGRLIRSEKDSGVFCVLDRRILEKRYGREFIRALPDMERTYGSCEQIAQRIKDWLD